MRIICPNHRDNLKEYFLGNADNDHIIINQIHHIIVKLKYWKNMIVWYETQYNVINLI